MSVVRFGPFSTLNSVLGANILLELLQVPLSIWMQFISGPFICTCHVLTYKPCLRGPVGVYRLCTDACVRELVVQTCNYLVGSNMRFTVFFSSETSFSPFFPCREGRSYVLLRALSSDRTLSCLLSVSNDSELLSRCFSLIAQIFETTCSSFRFLSVISYNVTWNFYLHRMHTAPRLLIWLVSILIQERQRKFITQEHDTFKISQGLYKSE
jgi:hypothetical protein